MNTAIAGRAEPPRSWWGRLHRKMVPPSEGFEAVARRYAAIPRNQRTSGNWLREFAQFVITPLSAGFNLDRDDRELRRPFPSESRFAPESKVWQREHAIAHPARDGVIAEPRTKRA